MRRCCLYCLKACNEYRTNEYKSYHQSLVDTLFPLDEFELTAQIRSKGRPMDPNQICVVISWKKNGIFSFPLALFFSPFYPFSIIFNTYFPVVGHLGQFTEKCLKDKSKLLLKNLLTEASANISYGTCSVSRQKVCKVPLPFIHSSILFSSHIYFFVYLF